MLTMDLNVAVQVDLDAMSDMERLEFELQRAQAAVADLHAPVMQGAYQRHIEQVIHLLPSLILPTVPEFMPGAGRRDCAPAVPQCECSSLLASCVLANCIPCPVHHVACIQILQLQQRIKEEREYLLRTKQEQEALLEEEDTTMGAKQKAKQEHLSTLERQKQEKERARRKEDEDRRRRSNVTLPVLATSEANQGAG